ncbi:CLUMA_CG016861, isoform A [Clunio marinus]|uniref:CLUMA_CG016861, isoform A n=1 Tax=Clunio marinus TaxID=568069 RepID=A0A1J1IT52_9DIPT|nr:CLUMA_CG016861, isoform A [Clunio marinus]
MLRAFIEQLCRIHRRLYINSLHNVLHMLPKVSCSPTILATFFSLLVEISSRKKLGLDVLYDIVKRSVEDSSLHSVDVLRQCTTNDSSSREFFIMKS